MDIVQTKNTLPSPPSLLVDTIGPAERPQLQNKSGIPSVKEQKMAGQRKIKGKNSPSAVGGVLQGVMGTEQKTPGK